MKNLEMWALIFAAIFLYKAKFESIASARIQIFKYSGKEKEG